MGRRAALRRAAGVALALLVAAPAWATGQKAPSSVWEIDLEVVSISESRSLSRSGGTGESREQDRGDIVVERDAPPAIAPPCGGGASTPYGGVSLSSRACLAMQLCVARQAAGDPNALESCELAHEILDPDTPGQTVSDWLVRNFVAPLARVVHAILAP